jgi:hypothetical protein
MKKRGFQWAVVVTLFAFAVMSNFAQQISDKYLISAQAGGVNFTQGSVSVSRANKTGGLLITGDTVEIGDKVSTGANGRVEILLNPGSYLRLDANSSMEFKTTSLDDLQIKLDGGSAIFEVFATNEFTVSIFAPSEKVKLIESGVYRIDIAGDGGFTVAVTEGKAMVGATEVKEGRLATCNGTNVAVTKFDRGKRDEFAAWSRSRAKDLAKTSSTLKNRDVRNSLMRSFGARRWNMFDSFGLWVFDPFTRRYCFLPFGYGWNSPYGYGYGTNIWWYNLPPVVYAPPAGNPTGTPPVRTAPIRTASTRNEINHPAPVAPPYTKIGQDRDIGGGGTRNNFPASDTKPMRDVTPSPPIVYVPPPAPPPSSSPDKKPGGN